MSKKINNYIVFDFETGGLDVSKNPICEFACKAIKGTTYEEIIKYDNIIKPYDEKLIYEQEATNLHGLSKEVCERQGIPLSQFIEDFLIVCQEANTENSKIGKPILVGHNVGFDISFLIEVVVKRGNVDLGKYISGKQDCYGNFQPDYIDTLQLMKNVDGNSPDKAIKFSLSECCKRMGSSVVDGHRAMNDVLPTTDLFVTLMSRLRSSSVGSPSSTGVVSFREKFQI